MPHSALSSRRSSYASGYSHLTILQPRDFGGNVSTDDSSIFGAVMPMEENDSWVQRARFFCRILCFCLGPGNIWRFPRHAYGSGNATYIYIYIIYTWVFGITLLTFDVGLGQYFTRGFGRMFSFVPLLEGITLSMTCYCVVASILYNMVCVYSFMYVLSGAFYNMTPHSYCSEGLDCRGCLENSTQYNTSSEYVYFFAYIVEGSDHPGVLNWRSVGILILILTIIGFMILFAVIRNRWVPIIFCCSILVTLVYTLIAALTTEGGTEGLKKMFIPTKNDIDRLSTWIFPFEQVVVSLGLGSGPLAMYWPMSKLKYWAYKHIIMIHTAIFCCTIFSGMIFFSAAGVMNREKNLTVPDSYKTNNYYDLHPHIVVTALFNSMPSGLDKLSIVIFYLLMLFSCLYTSFEYVEIFLIYANTFDPIKKIKRAKTILFVCFVIYGLGMIGSSQIGFKIIMAIDKNFIATSLLLITSSQMAALSYFYGTRNLCDDVEFVLGFVPNYYYQIFWLIQPVLLFMFFVCSFYLKCKDIENNYDIYVICCVVVLIIVPIAFFGIMKAIRRQNMRELIHPMEMQMDTQMEETRSGR